MDKRTAIHHAIVCMSVIEKIVPGYYPDGMLKECVAELEKFEKEIEEVA